MSYRKIFNEAVGEIPPSSIDLGRVIARQRRRLRLRRHTAIVAAAVTVAAITVGVAATTGRPRAVPPAAPSPSPTVRTPALGHKQAFTPTDMALFEAMGRVAPDLEWVLQNGAWEGSGVWNSGASTTGYTPDGYMGQGRVRSGDRAGHLSVGIPLDWGPLLPCPSDQVKKNRCATTTGPDGETIQTRSARNPDTHSGRSPTGFTMSHSVWVKRPDGVVIYAQIMGEDEDPPLTPAQLTALALDPAVAAVAADPLRGDTRARRQLIDSWVLAAIQRQGPGVTGAEGEGPVFTANDLGAGWSDRGAESRNTTDTYWGYGRVMVKNVAGLLSVDIRRRDAAPAGDLVCGEPAPTRACEVGTGPRGERHRTTTTRRADGVATQREVDVRRGDGTWLRVTLAANAKGKFTLSGTQQLGIALDPTVTLPGR
ncbi:hypothetical protein E1211_20700 [Micromonospora sp. 15K316]|uniref:hypothetical protein n=1 Tax=Micromonospora sp. 15K316 TaxID=2530376 RepID=UPI00104A13BC|nr:hypothetical protein [Micromonospora sp. 15K316]TDC32520.1 hypothetical protein E1211_20700 [Micromonospora sp. 15K316]